LKINAASEPRNFKLLHAAEPNFLSFIFQVLLEKLGFTACSNLKFLGSDVSLIFKALICPRSSEKIRSRLID
jgi:hypothetical protein